MDILIIVHLLRIGIKHLSVIILVQEMRSRIGEMLKEEMLHMKKSELYL